MIFVSSAAGSNDTLNAADRTVRHVGLARYIVPQQKVRVVANLPVDVFFTARYLRGSHLEVGIEYKTIWDVLRCIHDGRFAGNQLPALRDCDIGMLMIEGLIRRGNDDRGGRLEVYGAPLGKERGWYDTSEWGRGVRIWTYMEFEHWYFSMMFRGGVYVLPFTRDKWDSGRLVGSLWRSFNDKAWEEHTAHLATSKAHVAPLRGDLHPFVRAIIEYTGVGDRGALAAEREFGSSMREASRASVERWAGLVVGGGVGKGGRVKRAHKLGKKRAQQIVDELRGK